jgi:hypothetical protein
MTCNCKACNDNVCKGNGCDVMECKGDACLDRNVRARHHMARPLMTMNI